MLKSTLIMIALLISPALSHAYEWTSGSHGSSNSITAIAYNQEDGAQNIRFLDIKAIELCGTYYNHGEGHAYRANLGKGPG